MVGGSCIVYCTPPFLPHVILLEKNLCVGGNVCPICFARAVCAIDPTRPANAVRHGLWLNSEAADKEFIQAAALAYEYMRKNLRTPGPSLSPWLVFVGEPPRDPERYNLLQSTPLASIAIQARSVPLALGIAPLHQRGITRWQVRLRPCTQARLSCMRGPAVGP